MTALASDTAMVLAAGLGTRMRPLTNDRPKPLVQVAGKPLIDHALDRLAEAGIARAVVNVHHFGDAVELHLRGRTAPAIAISDERDQLLETGGGLIRAPSRPDTPCAGGPGGTRTPDLGFRKALLYPAELPGRTRAY